MQKSIVNHDDASSCAPACKGYVRGQDCEVELSSENEISHTLGNYVITEIVIFLNLIAFDLDLWVDEIKHPNYYDILPLIEHNFSVNMAPSTFFDLPTIENPEFFNQEACDLLRTFNQKRRFILRHNKKMMAKRGRVFQLRRSARFSQRSSDRFVRKNTPYRELTYCAQLSPGEATPAPPDGQLYSSRVTVTRKPARRPSQVRGNVEITEELSLSDEASYVSSTQMLANFEGQLKEALLQFSSCLSENWLAVWLGKLLTKAYIVANSSADIGFLTIGELMVDPNTLWLIQQGLDSKCLTSLLEEIFSFKDNLMVLFSDTFETEKPKEKAVSFATTVSYSSILDFDLKTFLSTCSKDSSLYNIMFAVMRLFNHIFPVLTGDKIEMTEELVKICFSSGHLVSSKSTPLVVLIAGIKGLADKYLSFDVKVGWPSLFVGHAVHTWIKKTNGLIALAEEKSTDVNAFMQDLLSVDVAIVAHMDEANKLKSSATWDEMSPSGKAINTHLVKLRLARDSLVKHMHANNLRMEPLVTMLVGDSSVGKSYVMQNLEAISAAVLKGRIEIVVRNVPGFEHTGKDYHIAVWHPASNDKYYSGYNGHLIIVADDVGAGNPDYSPDFFLENVISLKNSVPKSLNMADLDAKGSTFAVPLAVIASTNSIQKSIATYFTTPVAAMRRFDLMVRICVKEEYRKNGTTQLDTVKAALAHEEAQNNGLGVPDLHEVCVTQFEIVRDAGGEEIKEVPVLFSFVDENGQNREIQMGGLVNGGSQWWGVSISLFYKFYEARFRQHLDSQNKYLDDSKRMFNNFNTFCSESTHRNCGRLRLCCPECNPMSELADKYDFGHLSQREILETVKLNRPREAWKMSANLARVEERVNYNSNIEHVAPFAKFFIAGTFFMSFFQFVLLLFSQGYWIQMASRIIQTFVPVIQRIYTMYVGVTDMLCLVYYYIETTRYTVVRLYNRHRGIRVLRSFCDTISNPKFVLALAAVSTAIVVLCRATKSKPKDEDKDKVETHALDEIPPHPMDSRTHYVDQMGLNEVSIGTVSQGRVVRNNDEDVKKSIVVHITFTPSSDFGGGKGTAMGVTLQPGVLVLNRHTYHQMDRTKQVTLSWAKSFRASQREDGSLDPMLGKTAVTYPNQWVVVEIEGTELVMASVLECHVPTNLSLLTDDVYKPGEFFYMWTRNDLSNIETRPVQNTFFMTGDDFCSRMSFSAKDHKIPVPRLTRVMGGQVNGGKGTSGSPLVNIRPTTNGNQQRLRLFGIHCWGSTPGAGKVMTGYSCPLTKSLYNETYDILMSKAGRHSVVAEHTLIVPSTPTLGCEDPSLCEPGVVNSGYGKLGPVHPRAAVNFQTAEIREAGGNDPDVTGYLDVIGSFHLGDAGAFSTHFRETVFSSKVKSFVADTFGEGYVPNKVPPDVKRYEVRDKSGKIITPRLQRNAMSHRFIGDATNPNQEIDRQIMDAAATSYFDMVKEKILADKEVRECIAVYSNDIALNGQAGRRGMSSMNMSTSTGFNGLGNRMKKREIFPRDPVTDRYQLSPQQEEYINQLEDRVRRGEVLSIPFIICYKDEPVKPSKIENHDIRAFAIISWATSLLLRKYGLWIQRVMQIAPHIFGTAVGINCTSSQWQDLYNYISHDEDFKYFLDADYKKFDKKAISRFMTEYVRSIFLHLADLGENFDAQDKMALNALLYDVMNPWVIERMSLFQVLGMNSSGNNLTININTIANNLLVRYAYMIYKYKPRIQRSWFSSGFLKPIPTLVELGQEFEHNTRVLTLGDDLIIGCRNMDKDGFTNHVLIESLAQIGIEVTAPDKNDNPLAFKTGFLKTSGSDLGGDVPVEIAQRVFRRLDGFNYLTAPLNWKSIFKSLAVVNSAANLDPVDLWGARLRNVLTEAVFHGPEDHAKVWKFCRSLDFTEMHPPMDTDTVWHRSLLGRHNHDYDSSIHFNQVKNKFNNLDEVEHLDLSDDESELFLSRSSSMDLEYNSFVVDTVATYDIVHTEIHPVWANTEPISLVWGLMILAWEIFRRLLGPSCLVVFIITYWQPILLGSWERTVISEPLIAMALCFGYFLSL